MKKLFLVLIGLAVMGRATAQQEGNHWTPVGLEQNMSVSGIILIDGEEQMVSTLEVGAFCGDQCRGSRRGAYFGMTGQYVVPLQIQGNGNGEEITFRLYDHSTQQELDLRSINTMEFEANGRVGAPGNWYPFAFTTPVIPEGEFHFTTTGKWSQSTNWHGGALPGQGDAVFIDAPCQLDQDAEVAALTVSGGQTLTLQSGKTLTVTGTLTNTEASGLVVKDGAQLLHSSENVSATLKKNIPGYNSSEEKYCLISNPLTTSVNPEMASVNHLTSGNYDLYYWLVYTPDEFPWRNYKRNTFMLSPDANGYLYANERGVELSFSGTLRPSLPYYSRTVDYMGGEEYRFRGWNLIGNPFACNAYLVTESGAPLPYYRINSDGWCFEAVASGAIAPMQGVFYVAAGNGTVYFTRTAPAKKSGLLEMSVNQNGNAMDNAIIRFGEGEELKKLDLNEGNPQLFIRQDGKDYAVANANDHGEMAVGFKAEQSGSYTLKISNEDVEFSYLHLIDTLTGVDVDLMDTSAFRQSQGPASYTFNVPEQARERCFRLIYRQSGE